MRYRLGEFEILEPLAQGGMGRVWRARHPAQDLPVAVKVMSANLAKMPMWRERFRTEIRSMASLEHPGVVWVFDYGEIPDEVSAQSNGLLPSGAPWMAMEFASSGTLDKRIGSLDWSSIRALLLWMLDTLAHAHSRRVIHRDLKPGNVLLCATGDLRPGPKITDFGIAASLEDDSTIGERMLGTPYYMAPEQILTVRSDLGPWTDLYALGCVAWEMVCGRPPFYDREKRQVLLAHVSSVLPDFAPRISVPAELVDWLRTLLAKSPERRFASAPDAALALRSLTGSPEEEPADPTLRALTHSAAHSTLPMTGGPRSRAPRATWFDNPDLVDASARLDDAEGRVWPTPLCPNDWRRPVPVRRSRQLQGAGLALVGLRAIPLAGRLEERDVLWRGMVGVHREQRGRAIVVRGPAGTGKTRLARWLGERALEVGAARYLVARHSLEDPPGEGIAAAIRSELRSGRLSPDERRTRLTRLFGNPLGRVAAGWLHPEDEIDPSPLPAGERYAAIGAILTRMAEDRPVVLHLDDVHASGDSVRLVRYLLSRQRVEPIPLLMILTAQEEALAERVQYARQLEKVTLGDDVDTVHLSTLDRPQRVALLDGILGLDLETSAQVLERTGGNPLFAVHLVGEWAARGHLVAGQGGFRLADASIANAVGSLDALWAPRIERALSGLSEGAGVWLERMAVAGESLEDRYLQRLASGLRLDRQLAMDRLCDARLAARSDGRFSFVHGLVREAFRSRADRGGRLAEHHTLLAEHLMERTSPDPVAIGRHLLLGGHASQASRLLVRGLAEHRLRFGERAGLMACALAERALEGRPDDDPDWGRVALENVRALHGAGEIDAARRAAEVLVERATDYEWPAEVRIGAALEQAGMVVRSDTPLESKPLLDAIEADPELTEQHRLKIYFWRYAMGEMINDLDQCRRNGTIACRVLEGLGDASSRFTAAQIRAVLGFMFDDIDEAEPWAFEAVDRAERTGSIQMRAKALHNLGKVHWYRGRWDEAERALEKSEALYFQAGSVSLGNPRLMRIQVRLVQGAFTDALALCRDLVDKLVHESVSLRILHLVAHSGLGDWEGFEARFSDIQAGLVKRGWCNGEDATALEQLGQLALDQGMPDRARRVWEEALDHWERHDKREHREERVRARLAELAERGGLAPEP